MGGCAGPTFLALDVSGNKMYWTEQYSHTVWRADLNGGNPEHIVSGQAAPFGIALDLVP